MADTTDPAIDDIGPLDTVARRAQRRQRAWAKKPPDDELTLWPYAAAYVRERRRRGEIEVITARSVQSTLYGFSLSFGRRPLDQMGTAAVGRWLEEIASLAPATRRNKIGCLRNFCAWLTRRKLIGRDPMVDVGRVRQPRRVPRALNPDAVETLFAACETARERAIVALMVGLGLRCVEISRLEVADWDRTERTLLVRGKGHHERLLPVPELVRRALAAYRAETNAVAGPLFRSEADPSRGVGPDRISNLTNAVVARSGIKQRAYDGVSAHALRHTAASDVLDASGSLTTIQALLGHANLATTSVYLRRAGMEDLRGAVEGRGYGQLPDSRDHADAEPSAAGDDGADRLERFFAELGVITLERFLDEGAEPTDTDLTDTDLASYARVAAIRLHGPNLGPEFGEMMAELVARCVSGEGVHDRPDGVTVETSWGEPLDVTQRSMRHWLWLACLAGARIDLAERYLRAIPAPVRDAALLQIGHAFIDWYSETLTDAADTRPAGPCSTSDATRRPSTAGTYSGPTDGNIEAP